MAVQKSLSQIAREEGLILAGFNDSKIATLLRIPIGRVQEIKATLPKEAK